MSMSIDKQIDMYVNRALKGKQAFYENIQVAFEIFVANYNTKLNHDSTSLLKILKATGKEIQQLKEYIYRATNITELKLSSKGGLLLTFDSEFTFDNDYIDSYKWYDELAKKDTTALKELDDNGLYKAINSLLKRVKDSSKVNNKEYFIRNLELLSNSKQQ